MEEALDIETIRARMRERGYKQVDLANLLDVLPTAISKAFAGRRQFTYPEMKKIEAWLGAPATEVHADARSLPIIGQVAAGQWMEAVQSPIGHLPMSPSSAPKRAFALEVTGDSMDLKVRDGGTIIVDPDDKALFPGRYFVVINEAGETTFKQYLNDPARLVPCSTNKSHTEIKLGDGQAFTIIGRVVGAYEAF